METNYTIGSLFKKNLLKNVLFKIRIHHLKRFRDTSHNRLYLKNETVIKIFVSCIESKKKVLQVSKDKFQEEMN